MKRLLCYALAMLMVNDSQALTSDKMHTVTTDSGFTFNIDIKSEEEQDDEIAPVEEAEQGAALKSSLSQTELDEQLLEDGLRWDHTPKDIEKLGQQLVIELNATVNNLVAAKGPRTFENTMIPIDLVESGQAYKLTPLGFYSQVSQNKELRDAATKFEKIMGDFATDLWMREDLYKVIKEYEKNAIADGSLQKLDAESQRYVNKVIEDFETNGMKLPKAERDKVVKLEKEINEIEQMTQKNIADAKETVMMDTRLLQGFPAKFIEKLKAKHPVPGKPGFAYLSVKKGAQGLIGTMRNPEARKIFKHATDNINQENIPLYDKLNKKRYETSKILGYSSYSERVIESMMAKNVSNVEKLLNDLTQRISGQGSIEMDKILDYKKNLTHLQQTKLEAWDWNYYMGKYDKEKLKVNEKKLSEYFPAEHIKEKTLEIYQELLGLSFKKLDNAKTWNKEVKKYEVTDKETKKVMGYFYLDLYPRENKFNHAACFTLGRKSRIEGNTYRMASAAMVTNFSPPAADKPSLLTHDEVVTFFHEFGHVMHNMCNEAMYARFAGASVEKDFVEMPSQMLENWMWQPKVLKQISKHYKTNATLTDDLINNKIASQNVHKASETLYQVVLATVDLILNTAYDKNLTETKAPKNSQQALVEYFEKGDSISMFRKNLKFINGTVDSGEVWRQVEKKVAGIDTFPDDNPIGHFGHLQSGYVSTYYSYLWSQVYSSDLFSIFEEKGIMNKELGMKYRKTILAPGGSVDSIDSMRKFLGREPNDKAFIRHNGFEQKKK